MAQFKSEKQRRAAMARIKSSPYWRGWKKSALRSLGVYSAASGMLGGGGYALAKLQEMKPRIQKAWWLAGMPNREAIAKVRIPKKREFLRFRFRAGLPGPINKEARTMVDLARMVRQAKRLKLGSKALLLGGAATVAGGLPWSQVPRYRGWWQEVQQAAKRRRISRSRAALGNLWMLAF